MYRHFHAFKKFILPILLPTVFYFLALFTIYDYGINWDSGVHFSRGQAFLHYFLTGKTNYDDRPSFCKDKENLASRVDYKTGEICDRHRNARVSEFESYLLDFTFAKNNIYGHPAFGDIMLAVSNKVLFEELGILEDTQAYHFYAITLTYILALVIAIWAFQTIGIFGSIVSVLCFYLFPLLVGEQHFNIKDPPMAAHFTLAIYFFYLAVVHKKAKFMYISAIFGGMSFGTKLNFIFAPIILLPWVFFYLFFSIRAIALKSTKKSINYLKNFLKIIPKRILIALFFYPFIVFSIFYFSWPALWSDPANNFAKVLGFYKDVGVNQCTYVKFTFSWLQHCSNLQPMQYFLYTIPIISLFLFFVGYISGLIKWKEKNFVYVLWISFFSVTLLRVTLPIALSYGGLRQFLEFIGPFALLAGLGAVTIKNRIKKHISDWFVSFVILIAFLPMTITLIRLHPNENVYFNKFIGGLSGAEEKKFPGFGNTYGNANFQGIEWLNKHAEKNAKVTLLTGHGQDVQRTTLRPDLSFSGGTFLSGYLQKGEYVISLPSQSMNYKDTFRYKFFYQFLDPIYDIQVDDVSLLKIWKNDSKYIKKDLNLKSEKLEEITVSKSGRELLLSLSSAKKLKRLEIIFENKACVKQFIPSEVFISSNGNNFVKDPDALNDFTQDEIKGYNADISYLFAGDTVKAIKIVVSGNYECEGDISYRIYSFF